MKPTPSTAGSFVGRPAPSSSGPSSGQVSSHAAFVHAAAWWDADAGPPQTELLSRAERLAASFTTRILAHVLEPLVQRSPTPLGSLAWVLGSPLALPEPLPPGPELRRIGLLPAHGPTFVHAGPATVPMTVLEALGWLVEHELVLVAFVQDATPPHHEALACALLLSRSPLSEGGAERGSEPGAPPPSLVLEPPSLRRTSSHSARATAREHPFHAARALARAVHVGRPTVETVPSVGSDRAEHWRIELRFAS